VNAHPAIAPFALAIRILVSLVFLTAAYGKLRHRMPFQGVVANYRLLPDAMVAPAAYLIPPVELLLGATLLLGLAFPGPELGAAALLLLFALAMGINLRRGRRHIDCGCFQSALKQTLSWTLVMRNVVLALLMGVTLLSNDAPRDLLALMNGYLAGAVLFIILQALGILWSISPAWRRAVRSSAGAAS
jgi:uncharacterized membrane protein YphA (DoxX/SURF4 family)